MKQSEIISSLIWVALGTGQCIESIRLKLGDFHRPGPGFLPFTSGILLGLFGLVLLFSSISKGKEVDEESKRKKTWGGDNPKQLLLTLLALFVYALTLQVLGFLVATFIFLSFLFKLTHAKRWVMPLMMSGSAVILSYLIFCVWLRSTFPVGVFGF